jgi:hypothetical protein
MGSGLPFIISEIKVTLTAICEKVSNDQIVDRVRRMGKASTFENEAFPMLPRAHGT